jgi:small nuclear ribonucleoprotein (snRNP)-like protein
MDRAELEVIELGQDYRVVTTDGEELIARIVAIDMRENLFVYDIIQSNKAHACPVGHVLRFTDVAHVQHNKSD